MKIRDWVQKQNTMKSQREIKRRFDKLMSDVATNEYYKVDLSNRVNCYVCSCGHVTKTKDVDAGCTSFMHLCEKCHMMAKSTFYNDVAPNKEATEEWYRPTLKELMKMRDDAATLDHVFAGGLLVRRIKK